MKKRISRVVTRTGDSGMTSLADGERLAKSHTRMQAIGTVDELNSFLGLLLAHMTPGIDQSFGHELQQSLFDLGGALAFPGSDKFPTVEPLEAEVERLNSALAPLTEFVLPGGTQGSALAHVCRTLCRRAERIMWELPDDTAPGAQYLNRLSDYFFVLARTLNQGEPETQWRGTKPQD